MRTALRQYVKYITSALLAVFSLWHPNVLAYDDDRSISDVKLKSETFLDINANSPRKSLDLEWVDVLNGWRMAGGSTSTDRLFLESELRLYRELSSLAQVSLSMQQNDFYADKPFSLPQISIDLYPLDEHDIGFSIIGTAAHDKRQADLGYAFTLGRKTGNYVRASWLKVDTFYNEKNEFDDSYYDNHGETLALEGKQTVGDSWVFEFDLKRDRPLRWVSDAMNTQFDYESQAYALNIYYIRSGGFYGVNLEGFNIDKSLIQMASSERQELRYKSAELFFVNKTTPNYETTFGLRYDEFNESLSDEVLAENSFRFDLSTWQAYSSVYHEYTENQAWDIGIFAAWSALDRMFLSPSVANSADESSQRIEAKLRGSWQLLSTDRKSTLAFNLSLNLDNLLSDPGDGGGIYFQTRF
jgi:hypothetical protein